MGYYDSKLKECWHDLYRWNYLSCKGMQFRSASESCMVLEFLAGSSDQQYCWPARLVGWLQPLVVTQWFGFYYWKHIKYHSAFYITLFLKMVWKLQLVPNAGVHLLPRLEHREHVIPSVAQQHWLPISFHALCWKVLAMVFTIISKVGLISLTKHLLPSSSSQHHACSHCSMMTHHLWIQELHQYEAMPSMERCPHRALTTEDACA